MKPIIIVAGFGRCGSSLVMQMLEAGGIPVTGAWPAFEDQHANITDGGTIDPTWLDTIPGHAIKVLDPQNGTIPKRDYLCIWCSRDQMEQARSQVKFLTGLSGLRGDREMVRKLAASFGRDKKPAIRTLLNAGVPSILEIRFENLISTPIVEASKIADYVGAPDVWKMAEAVRQRSARCADGMDLELQLIKQRPALAESEKRK